MANKIVVIGSTNTDMVMRTSVFPRPGETVLGGEFFLNPGGKGANQAVAAARLGGQVTFVTKIGNDLFGEQALAQFRKESIHTGYILSDPQHPSGVALITVDAQGENTIVVAPGANGALSPQDIQAAEPAFVNCDVVLMQLEIPLSTVVSATQLAKQYGKKVMLNPAPATPLPDELLNGLFAITPNESEAQLLTGIKIDTLESAKEAAHRLKAKGVVHVLITLGERGVYVYNGTIAMHIPAPNVAAIDTTAAGDVFSGALAVAIAEGASMDIAAAFANRAAAISVTRKGAQCSAPFRQEVN